MGHHFEIITPKKSRDQGYRQQIVHFSAGGTTSRPRHQQTKTPATNRASSCWATLCFRCLGLEVVPQHYDVRFVAGVLVSKWCPNTKMYVLLLVSSKVDGVLVSKWWPRLRCMFCCRCLRSGAPALRCRICCRCLGLEVAPQHEDVRFVAGVLVSKWCPNTEMYVLLLVSSKAQH